DALEGLDLAERLAVSGLLLQWQQRDAQAGRHKVVRGRAGRRLADVVGCADETGEEPRVEPSGIGPEQEHALAEQASGVALVGHAARGALGADELREQDVPLLDRDRAGRLRLAYVAACALPADEVACPQDGSVREVAGQGVSGRGSDAAMDGERPAPGQIGDGGAAPGAAGLT